MESSSFKCEVLLGQDREPSWPRIGDLLAMSFPNSSGNPRIEPQRGGHAQLSIGRMTVEGTFIKYPSPLAAGTEHSAHVVIYAEAAGKAPSTRIDLARIVTAIGAAVALRKDCVGAIWNEVKRIVPVDTFRKAALRLEEGEDPLRVWVDMTSRHLPADDDRPEMGTTHTVGLEAFFDREMELELSEEDEATQRGILGGIIGHLFQDAGALQHQATFQIEGLGDYVVDMEGEGRFVRGPVCRLKRVRTSERANEKLNPSGGGEFERGRGRRCTAVILFDPARLPEPEALIRAIDRHTKRLGIRPTLSERNSERLLSDWGVVRGGGARKSEILHHGWSLPPALVSFITAENPDVVVRYPELLNDSLPVLIRELQTDAGQAPSILGATLLAHLSAAIMTLPGCRGIVWPTSGVLMRHHSAMEAVKGMGMEVPIDLGVARLALELEDGRRVFVTRGLAELGEQDVLLTCDDPADQRMRKVFDSLVRSIFQRSLSRRGGSFINELDGAEFELHEETIEGIGAVLKARLIKPPKPPAGLSRFLKFKS